MGGGTGSGTGNGRGIDPTRIDMLSDPRTRRFVGIAAHGNTPFDVPFISEITDDLWQGGCETGLILPNKVKHLVSLYPWEQYKVKHELKSNLTVRMYDSLDKLDEDLLISIACWINTCRKTGITLVHCQAGLNRSSLLAGLALILEGLEPSEAIALLRVKRSPAVLCNPKFHEYLMAWK